MKRRYTVWAAIIMAFALLTAACGSDEGGDTTTTAAPEETTTTAAETTTTTAAETTTTEALPPLVVWADEKRAPVVTEVGAAFTEATGVELQVEIIDFGSIQGSVIEKGPAGEGPDVFIGAHDWVGNLASNGAVAALDLGGRASEFTEDSLLATSWDGEQYGLPVATEALAMYYNPDLVPEPPTTIEELTAACDELAADVECLVVPGGNDAGDAYHHQPFITAEGGQLFGFDEATGFDGTEVLIGSDETVAGAELLEQLVNDGYVPSTNYGDAKNLFVTGKAAFWFTGPWEIGSLNNPEENTGAPNWSVALMPTADGNPMRPHVGIQAFYLSAYAKNPAIATEFLLNFIATPETMTALYEADPRGSAYIPTIEEIAGDPVAAVFAESVATGTYMPNIPEMGSVWGPVGDNFLLIRNGEIGAAEAMATAQEQVVAAIEGG
jgi:arabinogalactan oligomer/maltooligosaccharide transport system substrate-binding protein